MNPEQAMRKVLGAANYLRNLALEADGVPLEHRLANDLIEVEKWIAEQLPNEPVVGVLDRAG